MVGQNLHGNLAKQRAAAFERDDHVERALPSWALLRGKWRRRSGTGCTLQVKTARIEANRKAGLLQSLKSY